MPGYSTVTGENTSTVTMASGTSLFRKLVTVGNGFTVTGWNLDLLYGGEATTAAMGLTTGVPYPDLGLRFGLSYGASTFTPPSLLSNLDASSMLWYTSGDQNAELVIVPASTTWQDQYGWRFRATSRYQFRLSSASDFCIQIGNSSSGSIPFLFTATLRVSYA